MKVYTQTRLEGLTQCGTSSRVFPFVRTASHHLGHHGAGNWISVDIILDQLSNGACRKRDPRKSVLCLRLLLNFGAGIYTTPIP